MTFDNPDTFWQVEAWNHEAFMSLGVAAPDEQTAREKARETLPFDPVHLIVEEIPPRGDREEPS